jgi:hypothetical protein
MKNRSTAPKSNVARKALKITATQERILRLENAVAEATRLMNEKTLETFKHRVVQFELPTEGSDYHLKRLALERRFG